MKIILGSSSIYRKEVMDSFGYDFVTMSPDIDEKAIRIENPYELPSLIADAKRMALVEKISEPAILITADQVVVCDNQLYEKPVTEEDVKNAFVKYSAGYPAETVSALVVTNTETGNYYGGLDIAKVYFKPVPAEVVEEFIKTGVPFTNAGSFDHAHDLISPYIDRIEGDNDSVMGLPIKLLKELIAKVS